VCSKMCICRCYASGTSAFDKVKSAELDIGSGVLLEKVG